MEIITLNIENIPIKIWDKIKINNHLYTVTGIINNVATLKLNLSFYEHIKKAFFSNFNK